MIVECTTQHYLYDLFRDKYIYSEIDKFMTYYPIQNITFSIFNIPSIYTCRTIRLSQYCGSRQKYLVGIGIDIILPHIGCFLLVEIGCFPRLLRNLEATSESLIQL